MCTFAFQLQIANAMKMKIDSEMNDARELVVIDQIDQYYIR